MSKDSTNHRSVRLVNRQLRKSSLTVAPDTSAEKFVELVRATYAEADEQRLLNDNAFAIASAEMAELNDRLAAKNRQLVDALESLTRSKQVERLNAELSSKNQELSTLANTDSLTGLLNRYSFGRSLQNISSSVDTFNSLAVAIIDLDRFKLVNDTFGHNIGDQLLVKVAENLNNLVSGNDLVARLGGDEFAFSRILESDEDATEFAKTLSQTLQKPITIDQHVIHGGGSVGLALSTPGEIDPVRLMQDADTAMYRVKENSEIGYQVFDLQFRKEVMRRYTLEREVREALTANDFTLAYQPIVSASDKNVKILEALSRWESPTLGVVNPIEFIPTVERLGLSIEFGRMVLVNACHQVRDWLDTHSGMDDTAVAVNVSSSQLLDHGLTTFISTMLDELGLKPSCLVIELTESDLLYDFDRAVSVLSELRGMGIRIAIDDFGTGYSALAYLPHIPADFLKIDKAFVQNMDSDESVRRLTKIIVELADRFDLESIGEGVELEAQSEVLQQFGCDFLQGYLYGKPSAPIDVPALCGCTVRDTSTSRKAA